MQARDKSSYILRTDRIDILPVGSTVQARVMTCVFSNCCIDFTRYYLLHKVL